MAERPREQKIEGVWQSDFARHLEQLVRDARDECSSVGEKAVAEIAPLVPLMQQALDVALRALNDPDALVRLAALHGLLQGAGIPPEWSDLKGLLGDDDAELRLAAIRKLGRILPQVAVALPDAMTPEDSPAAGVPTEEIMEEPMEHAGRWMAWDREGNKLIAIADTYAALMKQVAVSGASNPVVKKAPGVGPHVPRQPFTLLDDESPQIIDDVRAMIPDADQWLDTPHTWFGGRRPRDLIGTEDEGELRDLLRGVRYGITA